MLTVKGERYYNDYTRKSYEKQFYSLDEIFNWLATESEGFGGDWDNYFPTSEPSRISAHDAHNRGWCIWIYQIENTNGILFSSGKYTSGQKFWAERVKGWCIESQKRLKEMKSKPNFVEM